jgi:transcriptional regulator with XRE-family HTH domain
MRRSERHFATPASAALAQDLGAALRAARLARNRTVADGAARARVSPRTLHRIERGDVAVAFGSWLAVIESLGLQQLLAPLARRSSDAVGEALRVERDRRRARRPSGADASHDF